MNPLGAIISDQIRRFGPMSVAQYMTLALLHPTHGYYTQHNPLGADGDFVTAPEISQMFGEMLGLSLLQTWRDQAIFGPFVLAELGPGRGTLMADILRVAQKVPAFARAAQVWLVEASPLLKDRQQDTIDHENLHWAETVADLPDGPLFVVANEFFDVLPVHQFQRTASGWRERMVGLRGDGFAFGLGGGMPAIGELSSAQAVKPGEIRETRPAANGIIGELATRIARFGGAGYVIDYGDAASLGNTLQAVARHEKVDPLLEPGRADLTAHVDFGALRHAAGGVGCTDLTPQGVFLERLGITERARALSRNLGGRALENHVTAHRRLTHPDEMGTLFKVLALHPEGADPPFGLE